MRFFAITLSVILIHLTYVYAIDGDATYYNMNGGYTACGEKFSDNDLIGAIAFSWWTSANPNNDPNCRKSARVTDPSTGKSVTVRIKDKCYGCKRGDIDLTPGAFQRLRSLGVGRFRVRWDFV